MGTSRLYTKRAMLTLLLLAIVAAMIGGVQSVAAQPEQPVAPNRPTRLMLPLMMNRALSIVEHKVQFIEVPSPTGASVTTDQPDYPPGAIVTVIGAGWAPGEVVDIFVNDDVGQTWNHSSEPDPVADSVGAFTYQFQLPQWFVANYAVLATGQTSGSATTTFTDLAIGTYDQCSNDAGDGYASGDTGCRWTNGNLQSNNSLYVEGDATVQRVWLTDFVPGTSHSITFNYGTTKSGKHAYDFLTTWDWSESWISDADRCQDIDGCATAASESMLDIPQDPNVPDSFEPSAPGDRQFVMRGGTLTGATTPAIVTGSYAGDSDTAITVSFTVASSGSMCTTKGGTTTCAIAMWFGAHVATQNDWGAGTAAGNISGSPYHVALDAVDGASVGQRDNQMQAGALAPNGTIVIVKDAVPNSDQDFSFNLTNNGTISQDFSLDDDADATLPNSQTFSVPQGTWIASEVFPLPTGWSLTNLVCVDPTNNTTVNVGTGVATINLASAETVTCTYTDTFDNFSLTASKTAITSYTRTYSWTIAKSVSPGSHSGFAGDTFSSDYDVVVDQTVTDSNFVVQGDITVNNPTPFTVNFSVSDSVGGTPASVSCLTYSLAPGTSTTCTYSVNLGDTNPGDGTNTATITSSTPGVDGTTAMQGYTFGEPTAVAGEPEVNVTDTFPFPGGTSETLGLANSDIVFDNDQTFTCSTNPADYTNGTYNYTKTNRAQITETGQYHDATVTVTCYAPVVTKTAVASYDETHTWSIVKLVNPASQSGLAGEVLPWTWTVNVSESAAESNFAVSGSISVYNPADEPMTVDVSDILDDAAATAATVDCDAVAVGNQTSLTVGAGETGTCSYSAAPGGRTATLNTATAALNGGSFSGTAPVSFVKNVIGGTATVTDQQIGLNEELTAGEGLWTFTGSGNHTCSTSAGAYGTTGSYTGSESNQATVTASSGQTDEASASTSYTCHELLAVKTAAGTYDRTVTWTLEKTVVPSEHIGYAGDTFESTWTVVATKNEVSGNYKVVGEITIENPAAVPQAFSISDVLNDGTVAIVTCPGTNDNTGIVPAASVAGNGSVTCAYVALPTGRTATLNTATVTTEDNPDMVATAAIAWTEALSGYDSGTLSDPRFEGAPWNYAGETISSSTTRTFQETFACPTDASAYTDSAYAVTLPNTAKLNGNLNLEASASVNLSCRLAGVLAVTKTVNWNGVTPEPGKTFEICVTGPAHPNGNCQNVDYDGGVATWTNLAPGQYTVTETNPGSEWDVQIAGTPVTVASSGVVTANVTNRRKLGSLQVTKIVNWNGLTPNMDSTFQVCIAGPAFPNGDCKVAGASGAVLTWNDLIPGAYAVVETDPGNEWTVAIDSSSVTVPTDGGQATATVTNTKLPPPRITVTKVVTETVLPQWNFVLRLDGGNPRTITKDQPTATWENLEANRSYILSEDEPGERWVEGSFSCTVGGVSVGEPLAQGDIRLSVVPGDEVTCVKYNAYINVTDLDPIAEPDGIFGLFLPAISR